jgi:PIN domain nuclease of toxin-antitoxin system
MTRRGPRSTTSAEVLVVLDTHAVLWWTLEPTRLGRGAREAIAEADRIGIPTIAFWETALLVRKGKLALQLSVGEWADRLLAIPRVEALPLTTKIALRADSLVMHADPADRFIAATALEESSRLVTKDALLRRLKSVKTVW